MDKKGQENMKTNSRGKNRIGNIKTEWTGMDRRIYVMLTDRIGNDRWNVCKEKDRPDRKRQEECM